MSRNLGAKGKSEIKTSVRKIGENPKKVVAKPLPQKPVLNSVLRLGDKVESVRNDLTRARSGGEGSDDLAVSLARNRIVNSPRTNQQFRKTVARKVDFRPDEQIFSHLASLSVSEDLDEGGQEEHRKRKQLGRPIPDQDPGITSTSIALRRISCRLFLITQTCTNQTISAFLTLKIFTFSRTAIGRFSPTLRRRGNVFHRRSQLHPKLDQFGFGSDRLRRSETETWQHSSKNTFARPLQVKALYIYLSIMLPLFQVTFVLKPRFLNKWYF